MKNNISVVIVHWNTPDLLKKQLDILSADTSLQVIVVDNNSEKSLAWVSKEFPRVDLINNKINKGFAAACNLGSMYSKEELLLFLNPDAHIKPKQVEELYAFAKKHQFVAVSPKPHSKNYQKPIPSTLSLLSEFTPLKYMSSWSPERSRRAIGSQRMTLTGGCLLINKKIFEKLCGFDERFFLWFEDSDLTKRLSENAYQYGFCPINISHSGGASFKKLDEQMKRDMFFFAMNVYAHKHFSKVGKWVVGLISKRYSRRKILPPINKGVTLTIPNIHLHLLHEFFVQNFSYLSHISELIFVSSSFSSEILWDLRKKYQNVRFIPIDKNKGVASTINIGFRASSTDFIGTVNDDTILSKDWIQKCLENVQNPGSQARNDPGSFNPLIYKTNGELESAGVDILPKGKAIPRKEFVLRHSERSEESLANASNSDKLRDPSPSTALGIRMKEDKCYKVDAVNAAVVIYTNEALNKTGIYDEQFGSYLEDIDHSLRLTRNGFDNIVVPSAKVIHVGQSTSKSLGIKKQLYDARNWWYVILKNWGIKKIVRYFPNILLERFRNISGVLKTVMVK